MINKKSTIDYSEHPLTKNFLNNIMSQGGEAAGVYTLKNDEKRVVRVVHALNTEMAEGGIYDLLVEIGKSEHWPSRALKTESIEVVHGNFSEDLKAAQLQVQQRGYGSHDLADFRSASKEQVGQLIKDISVLDRLGINFDAKPRNILFDKEIGFQLLDLIPKTLYANAQEAMERNSAKDANHIKRIFGIAQRLLGNTFSNQELQEAVKSINSNKPIIGSSTSVASVVQPTITATAVPVATTSTQTQAPINSTKPLKDRILSFDIETSSLDPQSGFVWQTGFASESGTKSDFFTPYDTTDVDEIESRLTTTKFGQEQSAAGSFKEYLNKSTNRHPQEQFLGSIYKTLLSEKAAGRDILLIQNANFERRWMEAASMHGKKESAAMDKIIDMFEYSYMHRQLNREFAAIYPSPDIMQLRNEALNNYYSFLKSGDQTLFDKAADSYSSIMEKYKSLISTPSKKFKVVDMMDLTRGMLFKAAQKGYIEKNMALIGTSQNFLSEIFGLGKESHLAPDDAEKARKIAFEKILPMYNELASGNISQQTIDDLARIKAGQPNEAARQFGKSIIRALDEGSSQYGYRMLSDIQSSIAEEIEFLNNETGSIETSTRKFRTSRLTLNTEEDLDLILRDVSERYYNIDMGNSSAQSIIDSILNKETFAEKRSAAIDVGNKLQNEPTKTLAEIPGETISKDGILEWIKGNKIKTAIGAGAAIGMGAIIMSSDQDYETIRKNRQMRNRIENSTDANLRLYSVEDITPKHGSGFADWNDRTQHHYY